MTTKAYAYQLKGIRKMHWFGGRYLLADEPGLGKTYQSIKYADEYIPIGRPHVIVCPATIKINWQREVRQHIGADVDVLTSRSPSRALTKGGLSRQPWGYVVNYDVLEAWLPLLSQLRPRYVIGDEIHYIKERKAKRTKAFKRLCMNVPHIGALSGTPMLNRPAELFPILNILRPDLFGSFWSFGDKFCEPQRKPWGWEFKGASNIPELNELLLSEVMIRRRKADVLDQLPAVTRIVVPLECNGMKEYRDAEQDLIKWLLKTKPERAKSARKAERLTRMGYLKRLAGTIKLPVVKQWINDWLEEDPGKLLVFGVQREKVVEYLHHEYRGNSVAVHGGITGTKRQAAIDAFNTVQQKRLLFGHILAAGQGWSCKSASTVAFCELGWNPAEHKQAESRIHGIARGLAGIAAMVYYLIAAGTLEEDLLQLLQDKQEVSDAVLDGRPLDDGLESIRDLLEEALIRKAA